MTCPSCKAIIEDIATDFPEIKSCEVSLESGIGNLEYNEKFDLDKFKSEIENIGKYELEFTP